ncbi:conserved hypothetical protein [Alteracholeplasma palmae J233]|uniref:Uncharacterized protein n=1 Tax=Alteracholeplasma palmae (strain ATCC 49389 / J233) TaxID=1318466 RepID=U4KQQ6_ALTPJ|nr:lamin tail domain-containing protein [Alteracholeplasma palmae]CCV64995.1 conserved hypothetical protein [Alteracholeplasma palmae J233]
MKKFTLLILAIFSFFLVSCTKEQEVTTSSDIHISKYYETFELFDNVIELYNPLEESVNLSNYKLEIYSNGEKIVGYSIDLSGIIEPKNYYVIANDKYTNEIVDDKKDLATSELVFNGDDVIALVKDDKIIDILGDIGNSVPFARDVTLIRKPSAVLANSKYDEYSFIFYTEGQYQYLKNDNYEVKTEKELIEGPQFLEEYKNMPFVNETNENKGGGGAIKVKVHNYVDGDTTHFIDDEGNIYKMRYYLIDTREVNGTNVTAQEWGYPASNFTNNILKDAMDNNKEIWIQTVKGGQLIDTYSRHLGYVWVDGKLVNYEVVRAGMSDINFNLGSVSEGDLEQTYKNIPLFGYVLNAASRAQKNGWGIHGEKDPNWNYDTKKPTSPHNFLPDPRFYKVEIDG